MRLALFLLVFLTGCVESVNVDALISARTEAAQSAIRAELRREIFGAEELPKEIPTVTEAAPIYPEALRQETLKLDMGHGIVSESYLLYRGPKLAIYHAGHADSITDSRYVRDLLTAGYSVLAVAMPLKAPNSQPYSDHDDMASLERPLSYFFRPLVAALNYAQFDDVYMVGLSGGGWTAVVYDAIDQRIDKSYIVAGTAPKYIAESAPRNYGDFEQKSIRDKFEYLDLYILAGRQMQIFHANDECCFAGDVSLGYEGVVSKYAEEFDVVIQDEREHGISPNTMKLILQDMARH